MTSARSIRIMGILNVTPDSFSDGGRFDSLDAAKAQAEKLITDGADILDIGGESTRPYAEPVSVKKELARVVPVVKAVRSVSSIPISIDTSKAEVARQALAAGADIINDITALRNDHEMIDVIREHDGDVIIMHMQGTPRSMQDAPHYEDVVDDVISFLRQRIIFMTESGIDPARIIVDPGIGFGKALTHNLQLLKHVERFSSLGHPVLLGHSRKRFLGDITGLAAEDRDAVSAVVSALCAQKKISIIRVHDVAATKSALQVADAIELA